MNSQLPFAASPVAGDYVELLELWRSIGRQKWRVLGVAFVFFLIGTLVAFSAEPLYRSSITLLIEARPSAPVQVKEVYDPGYESDEYFDTQTELLKSRELIGRVVDQLQLASNPEIVPPPEDAPMLQRIMSGAWLPWLSEDDKVAPAPNPALAREVAIDSVLRRLTIVPIQRTQLRKIYVESHEPRLAASIANAVGDLFINSTLDSRLDATERATRWLTTRLEDLRTKLQASDDALQAYREKHQLVNIGGTRGLYEEGVVDNARKLRDAQRKKTELASTYWKIKQAGDDDSKLQEVSALLLDPTVQKAGDNLLEAQEVVKQLQDRYGEKHPQMTTAQARLRAARQAYYNQLRLAANGVKAEYEIAEETERALTGIVESGKAQIRKLDERDYEVQSLEREVQTNRELYEMFLKRYKETDETSSYEPLNVRFVDRAVVPIFPSSPKKLRLIAAWTLGGFLLGMVLAALRHLFSETIRSPEHLEHATQLPVLSVLPPVSGLGRKSSPPKLCVDHPRAPFPEGVRSIRASLHLSDVDKRIKRIMFTSALPQEGKSSLSSSFAAVLAHTERVLLVEADLRAPSLKQMFGIASAAPGLLEVLTGQAKVDDAIVQHAETGAHVLPVAKVPANPAEVVASKAFADLMDTLTQRYDRVIFDTPPCQVASDSLLLAQNMDAVVFVIHGSRTGMRAVQAAIKHLRNAQAPLFGHVLNRVDARKTYGYDGSYYVYGQYSS